MSILPLNQKSSPALNAISYWDLLDLPRVGDDLLHDLHGLTLGLSGLSRALRCCSLDDLNRLALTHLHGNGGTLVERRDGRRRQTSAQRERKKNTRKWWWGVIMNWKESSLFEPQLQICA